MLTIGWSFASAIWRDLIFVVVVVDDDDDDVVKQEEQHWINTMFQWPSKKNPLQTPVCFSRVFKETFIGRGLINGIHYDKKILYIQVIRIVPKLFTIIISFSISISPFNCNKCNHYWPHLVPINECYVKGRCHLLRLRISYQRAPPFKETQVILCPVESIQHNRNVLIMPFGSVGKFQVTPKELVFEITFTMTGSPGTKKITKFSLQINKGFR